MTLDVIGRRAGAEVRRAAARNVSAVRTLDRLHRTDRARRRSGVLVAVTVTVLVAGLGWWALAGAAGASHLEPSGHSPRPTVTSPARGQELSSCDQIQQCLGQRSYMEHIEVPFTLTLPAGWSSAAYAAINADFYSADPRYGVSVLEDIAPAGIPAGASAESVARWMAARPFLVAGAVTPTTFVGMGGGTTPGRLPAWQVVVRLKPHQPAASQCLVRESQIVAGTETTPSVACTALLLTNQPGFRSQGMWGAERIRWIFFDLPNGKPAAAFIWDFSNRPDMITPAAQLLASLVFS